MTTQIANDLLSQLKLRQIAECMSGRQFAEKLGISHQLWQMTRAGKREIGLVLLKAIVKAYPILNRDVLLFLAGPGYAVKPPENVQDSLFSRLLTGVMVICFMAALGGLIHHKIVSGGWWDWSQLFTLPNLTYPFWHHEPLIAMAVTAGVAFLIASIRRK